MTNEAMLDAMETEEDQAEAWDEFCEWWKEWGELV